MSAVQRFDHVGITVADLETATRFFAGLGFETEGRTFLEGEFVDTVTGIPDSRTEIVVLRPPDGGTAIELASFIRADHEPGSPDAMANHRGCGAWRSKSTTSWGCSTGWPPTATARSAASVTTRACGPWRVSAGPRGSS